MAQTKRQMLTSVELYQDAKEVMPGGVTANIKHFPPHPIYMNYGEGAYLSDADGNKYVDYLLSYGSMMLGHGHPEIKEAIHSQMEQSGTWLFGTPHELEVTYANKIKEYFPSIDLMRYTNSGTEATLLALRFAEAYTGKHKVAKFEGHYHGGYNEVLLSVNPEISEAGQKNNPNSVPSSKGISAAQTNETIVLPFNDDHAFEILTEHASEIGAVVLEPIQGGFIPAEDDFMTKLRNITEELNIVLIFDEVKTGFRTNLGGTQALYGIKPDLTVLGKVIGGGFPMGVVGGKREILMVSSPVDEETTDVLKPKDVLFHSGTYNGHPMILAAGLRTINILENELDHVLNRTEKLKTELESLFFKKGIAMQAVGNGSMFNVILSEKQIRNYRDYQQSDMQTREKIDYELLNKGIYAKPLNRYSLSTCHKEAELEKTLNAYNEVLAEL
ncbi:MAG TPA: aspartate aminotransferase family protein [Lentibacillus sp.]|uniref:aspartate aminotransferase family protein n=1 Tax=Lentibacillus sp. TaxID=1925746 RepID=UPI002B4AEB76|nr:aspartate aminotransferase family protein [Lentibacillus sp.]HLR63275.1 aspartate aminotransferase family protein [Lentibacillus sp.]